ncbi:sulfotransferase family protein [Planctomicrobium piriforme]|uniref:Sulfotransferase family protein n=1 Tax=Planctomicrobium piriforme TaxID=1576369 RepID=A0A1I3CAD2_9PLAN|nr:sulfotransferase [Planctomicrobium piriforme]SFH71514.1 Sulfotransferase family protein [Planctomicrobium piriforme]
MSTKPGSDNKVKRSSQGQLILYHGMKLSTMVKLLKLKPSLRWSRFLRMALMPGFGLYNSFWAGVENLLYGQKIRETQLAGPPIFILGYWRSGTTLLHNLMTLDPRYSFPTLYETIFPWHFLSTETINTKLTGWMVPKSRPMDNVEVHWGVPQEDEFAICTMCLVSPYTLPLRPFDQQEWTRSFRIEELPEDDRKLWDETMTLFMKKLTVRSGKPLVMKSPSHTYRVKALLRLFPDAKFVFIARHPFDVFNSAKHLRATMIEENSLGSPYHPDAEESIIGTFNEAYEAYERDRSLIPAGNLAEVKYEELAQDPLREMSRIYAEMNLGGFDEVRRRLEVQLKDHKEYKRNKFQKDRFWQQQVYDRCRAFYERFGYSGPEQEQSAPAESSAGVA